MEKLSGIIEKKKGGFIKISVELERLSRTRPYQSGRSPNNGFFVLNYLKTSDFHCWDIQSIN